MKFQRVLLGVVAAAMALATACSDGGGAAGQKPTEEPATSTTAVGTDNSGGSAKITQFDVPQQTMCGGSTSTTVAVTYQTSGASRVELRVDGRPFALDDPAGGTVDADIRCDALPHDFVLFAFDTADKYTFEKKLLETAR